MKPLKQNLPPFLGEHFLVKAIVLIKCVTVSRLVAFLVVIPYHWEPNYDSSWVLDVWFLVIG